MTKCFIHIGMEKTGTTTIQRLLGAASSELRDAGVSYPLGRTGRFNHNFLAASYIPTESVRLSRGARSGRAARQPQYLAEYRSHIFDEIGRTKRVVISGEHLFRLNAAEVGAIKRDLLAAGVDEVCVLGVLRNPASFYLSFVQQELKGSSTYPAPDQFLLPYAQRARGWMQHFECTFLEYQTLVESPSGIVGTFLTQVEQCLGVDLSRVPQNVPYVNDSLSPEEMQLVQDFRRTWFPRDDGKLNRATTRLVNALRRNRDTTWRKPVLRPEVEALILERHRSEMTELAMLTGVDMSRPASAVQAVHGRAVDARDILGNFDATLYDRLCRKVRPARYVSFSARLAAVAGKRGRRLSSD